MQSSEDTYLQFGLRSGLITSTSLIVYFMIMKFGYFIYSPISWSFNFVILYGGIILTYHFYRSETKLNIDYFGGLILGVITTVASVIPLTIFMYCYFSWFNPMLLPLLKDNVLFMGEQITPLRAAAATLIEGISSGVVISFMMMQYYRSGFRQVRGEITSQG